MIFDYSKLRGRIVELFGTCKAFAAVAGYKPGVLSSRLTGSTYFPASEVKHVADLLRIQNAEIGEYFFTLKVR